MGIRLLFYQWNAFMQRGIENALKRLKVDYDVYYDIASDWDDDVNFCNKFEDKLVGADYQAVLSVNFMPLISDICQKHGIRYISWVYDSPLHIRRLDTMKNLCNIIYFFDHAQAEYYKDNGVAGAEYLPLAVDPEVFNIDKQGNIVADNKPDVGYCCDVSLLGQLYKSEYGELCKGLGQYNRGYLEGIIGAQSHLTGGYIVDEMLSDDVICSVNKDFLTASGNSFEVTRRELSYTIAKEVTGRQRFTALALLQDRCDVNIYSTDVDKRLSNVKFCGYADYYTQMPEVFRKSRINLNISLCTIQTGIPLRVLDIMACGGFVLTNAQPEIMEYFTPGEELEVYEDMKDLVIKVKYYLEYDKLREDIAAKGYRKVCEMFTFDDRIKYMLRVL